MRLAITLSGLAVCMIGIGIMSRRNPLGLLAALAGIAIAYMGMNS